MIGKYEWFRRRKYTGWGFTPVTWQGWVYVAIAVLPLIVLSNLKIEGNLQNIAMIVWGILIGIDFIDIMIHLPKDERDRMHEAMAERNALWAIMLVLGLGVAYESATSAIKGIISVDPFIIGAIFVGLFVKIISNIYLDKKD